MKQASKKLNVHMVRIEHFKFMSTAHNHLIVLFRIQDSNATIGIEFENF